MSRTQAYNFAILFSVILFSAIFIFPPIAYASTTYNFNADTIGQAPSNMTITGGAFQVANNGILGQSLEATAKTGEIAGALFDSFPLTTDMSVVWKHADTSTTGNDGFILRAQPSFTSLAGHTGARQGYLFQLYGSNTLYIWKLDSVGFTQLWTGTLAKSSPRYFRAKIVGSTLTFDYSSDGISFTNLGTVSDPTFSSGIVQYTAGYGVNVGVDYVDDVVLSDLALSLSGSNSFSGATNVAMPITDLQISGDPTFRSPVKLFVTSGTLAMSTTTGLTFTGPSTGSTLYFSGTVSDINAALATLTYTRSGTGSDTLEVSLVNSGEVFFSDNGHLYKFITGSTTWNSAFTSAPLQAAYGATGYLATITSSAENSFISGRLSADGWIGASDSATEGDWKWVTGDESGTSFWTGAGGGHTVGGNYANWNAGEPNDSGGNEDCAEYYSGSGMWNDLPCSGSTLSGYVVEFGKSGNMPIVAAKNISITTSSDVTPPTVPGTPTTTTPTTSVTPTWTWAPSTDGGSGLQVYVLKWSQSSDCNGGSNTTTGPTPSYTIPSGGSQMNTGTWYFCVAARDVANNTSAYSSAGSVVVDTQAPVISSVSVSHSPEITISWTTDEASSSIVEYGLTASYGTTTTEIDTSPRVTSHSVFLSSLSCGTTYYFRVKSNDSLSNLAQGSGSSFVTNICKNRSGGKLSIIPLALQSSDSNSDKSTPLSFTINDGQSITSSPILSVSMNANPLTVKGYSISLDPTFTKDPEYPYVGSNTTFTLPDINGSYKVYLRYYSLTGKFSDLLSQTIRYQKNTSQGPVAITFTRSLRSGSKGSDVTNLQQFLNTHGFPISKTGAGSPGYETNIFGPKVLKAVKLFQKQNGISPINGIVGPMTRKKMLEIHN